MNILLSTFNNGKITEIKNKLPGKINLHTLKDVKCKEEIEETGKTFSENALIKSRYGAEKYGMITIADDSGLCVDALNGFPGVYSARWCGEGASDKLLINSLLEKMIGIYNRSAKFITVFSIVNPFTNQEILCEGILKGVISSVPKGTNGFGYDPIFYLPELKRTLAELTLEEKNKISHRSLALKKVKVSLNQIKGE